MGPPKFIGGNRRTKAAALLAEKSFNGAAEIHRRKSFRRATSMPLAVVASMGPPKFIGGNIIGRGTRIYPGKASMGPPKFIGGNGPLRGATHAGLGLQWGRRNSSAEMRTRPLNQAAVRKSFNGAAEIHRRKWPPGADDGRPKEASMGPPKFIGGNANLPPHLQRRMWLQWGRRNSSAEIFKTGGQWYLVTKASMGPPKFIGGNHISPYGLVPRNTASMGPPKFIGGNRDGDVVVGHLWQASMGPPKFIGGNLKQHTFVHDQIDASMGPPKFIGGNPIGLPHKWTYCYRFNGAAEIHRRKSEPGSGWQG